MLDNLTYNQAISYKVKYPKDLADLIKKSKRVQRYEDPRNPDGMIKDTLDKHLVRLASFASKIKLTSSTRKLVIRTIWIHDLPEVVLGDQSTILKSDKLIKIQDEERIARKMLTSKDYKLYKNYENSSDFLKGNGAAYDDIGLITKILDSIDGNLYFHKHFHRWVSKGNNSMPPDSSIEFTFNQYRQYIKQLDSIQNSNLYTTVVSLLNWQIRQIKRLWIQKNSSIPTILQEKLNNF